MSRRLDLELLNFIRARRDGANNTAIAVRFPESSGPDVKLALRRLEIGSLIYWDPIDGFKRKS